MGGPNTVDWITAGSSVLAAVGTVGALWVGAVAFKRQADTQRRDQASRVSVRKTGPLELLVENQSDHAIHDVVCFFRDGHEPKIARYKDIACDTSEDVVVAGDCFSTKSSLVPYELRFSAVPYVVFTDAEGRRWRRDRGGELSLVRRGGV